MNTNTARSDIFPLSFSFDSYLSLFFLFLFFCKQCFEDSNKTKVDKMAVAKINVVHKKRKDVASNGHFPFFESVTVVQLLTPFG